jgi:tRNA A-37 threonylcarbamoyl transferase component Bud32
MPTPPPDPTGRPSSAKRAPGSASADRPEPGADAGGPPAGDADRPGSTESHHSAPVEPLSELIRGSSSARRSTPGSDILQMLSMPGASPIVTPGSGAPLLVPNTDDAPTVITRNNAPPLPPPPLPLPVTGDPPSVAGRRLGHFELIEAIGAGGMAAVLKARDLELDRVVALKILPPEAARDPESVTRFKQEARAAAMLDHENVARVYFCGEDQGLHFIAFEFVEGENLRVLIDRRGTISPGECVRYMIQVAAGLNHAAERGVVHRDIKPSNILITPDGRAKIVDMGLARQLDATPANGGVTQSGVTLGTFDYISPEQALDPRRADVRSDIYSLGCAFYHALTGRPPVPEGTAAKKLHAHQHLDPLDPRELNPAIPDELAAVLTLMMAKDPEQRYQTPADLIADLKGVAQRLKLPLGEVASDSAVRAVPASQAVLPQPPRLRLGWALAAAAVAVAVAAFALSVGNFPRSGQPPWGDQPGKGPDIAGPGGGVSPHGQPTGEGVVVVRTARELADALADAKTKKVHLDPGTFDLTKLPEGVAFAGKELELVGPPGGIATIVVAASHNLLVNGQPPPGSLSVGGPLARVDSFTARGVWFEVHPDSVAADVADALAGGDVHPPGLAVHAAHVHLIDCVFASHVPADDESVAVAVSAPADAPPVRVLIQRCAFGHGKDVARGGFAVQVPARSEVTVDDSGFGPHAAAIQVAAPKDDGNGTDAPPAPAPSAKVSLLRSSFLFDPRSAVVAAATPVTVTAGYCVFAPAAALQTPLPAVLNVASKDGARFSFTGVAGQKNAYYRVNPLAVGANGGAESYTFGECKEKKLPAADAGAVNLAQRPWYEAEPPAVLAGPDPWRAFRLKLTDPAVFVDDNRVVLVGVQFHDDNPITPRRAYPRLAWTPVKPKSPAEPRQLVWYPFPKDGEVLPPGTSADLVALLRVARLDEVIFIHHDGLLPLEAAVELKARAGATDFKVTFKPFPDTKPVLAAQGGQVLDQTLFRLLNGEVTFDGIQFLLKPSRPRSAQKVAAVAVIGGKACTFTNCVFTLAEEDDSKAAVVVVDDPDKVMAMDGAARPTPDVKFERCVIRGRGRGVWVPVSRAVRVDASHTLTAIDGPLFLAEPGGKMMPGAESSLRLTRVTALVGGPVVELRGGKVGEMRASGLVKLTVTADECLFAAVPAAGQPLVEFDGIDPAEAKTVLAWQVQKANRYANFDPAAAAMVIRPGVDGSTPKESNWTQWIDFAGEPPAAGKPVGKVTFEKGPTGLRDLAAIRPADAAVKDVDFPDVTGVGAKPTDAGVDPKMLPLIWEDEPRPE